MSSKRYWFKRKTYGWGWYPSTLEGWLVLLAWVFVYAFIFIKIDKNSHSASDTLIGFFIPFVLLTVLLIVICYIKGEKPRWQWGKQ